MGWYLNQLHPDAVAALEKSTNKDAVRERGRIEIDAENVTYYAAGPSGCEHLSVLS